jgi:hypothetical protein
MSFNLSKNCGRYSLDDMAVSKLPMLGVSNHSERNATNQAYGSWKNKGTFDIAVKEKL